MHRQKISKIVITGGPCAGKTTTLAYLTRRLSDFGFKVILVNEMATDLINAGIGPKELGPDFQHLVLKGSIEREDLLYNGALAMPEQRVVMLCDRGLMDGRAYIAGAEFVKILRRFKLTEVTARDERYEGVVHLVTAADGAKKFYTLANNTARSETPDQARRLDTATMNAWNGHPHLRIIDNSTDFEKKKQRTLEAVCHILGVPQPIEIENKYLVRVPDLGSLPVHCQAIDIHQIYLRNGGRIRERGQNGSFTYFWTMKKKIGPKSRIEVERIITAQQFSALFREQRSEDHVPVRKNRICFVWKNQYFELDIFQRPHRPNIIPSGEKKLSLLEIELTEEQDRVSLPPFIDIVEDVTMDKRYRNSAIARI